MSTEYSRINWPDLRYLKKIKKKNYQQYMILLDKLENGLKEFYSGRGGMLRSLEVNLMQNLVEYEKEQVNFFIDKKCLSDFCVNTKIKYNTVLELENSICNVGINNIGCDSNGNEFQVKSITGAIFTKTFERTIFFHIVSRTTEDKKRIVNFVTTDGNVKSYASFGDTEDKERITNLEEIINKNDYLQNINRLLINSLFYMSAYPENVLDQPPDERINDKINKNNTKTLTISKEISGYLKNTELTPHLRRGHFRFLGSDFFKKKKGKTVFVKSSFVKGKAKTVIGNNHE